MSSSERENRLEQVSTGQPYGRSLGGVLDLFDSWSSRFTFKIPLPVLMGRWFIIGLFILPRLLLLRKSFGVAFKSLSMLASSFMFGENWLGSLMSGHFMFTVAVA